MLYMLYSIFVLLEKKSSKFYEVHFDPKILKGGTFYRPIRNVFYFYIYCRDKVDGKYLQR